MKNLEFKPVKGVIRTGHLNVVVPKELQLQLKAAAKEFDLPISQFIEQALRFYLTSMKRGGS